MYLLSSEASNRADWIVEISAIDADSGADINFTGATIVVAVKDEDGCQRLLATTDNGKVTLPSSTVAQFEFAESDMKQMSPGTYQIGATYSINGEINQLFVGSVAIYDGVVP